MALDLSALEDDAPAIAAELNGKPLEISLELIDEDPDQPRTEFSEESMKEMIASVKARGVKSPVSVRSNPDAPGRWLLNFGARRYRASRAAGKLTIPAFVDEAHDNYDQIIENLHRDDLKPMELALFIRKRLALGEKKGEIAKHLGKDSSIVTNHLALLDAPACIEEAYTSGKCTSAKTLYELRSLHDKYPKQVEAWCAEADVIDRRTVAALGDELKGNKTPSPTAPVNPAPGASAPAEAGAGSAEGDQIGGTSVTTVPFHNPDTEKEPKEPKLPDPDKITKPLLLVEYGGREAMLLLSRRPSSAGLVHLRYEDGSGEEEVDAASVRINLLTEATH